MPNNLSKEDATHTALDLIGTIKENTPAATFMNIGDKQRATLTKLSEIFHDSLKEEKTPSMTLLPPPPAPHPIYMLRMPTMAQPPMAPPMQHAPQMRYMPNGPLPMMPQTQANMRIPHMAQPNFAQTGQTCPSPRVLSNVKGYMQPHHVLYQQGELHPFYIPPIFIPTSKG
eukprot:7216218-Ditylum_brightwellii.AAC.1